MWITWPALLQCKDSEIAQRSRVLRRAQDVVSLSNHGGRGEEGLEREAGRPAGRPYIFLRALRPLRLNSSSGFCSSWLRGEYFFTVNPEQLLF